MRGISFHGYFEDFNELEKKTLKIMYWLRIRSWVCSAKRQFEEEPARVDP